MTIGAWQRAFGHTMSDQTITLFDTAGRRVAYIAPDEQDTIYSWSGRPVAYLHGEHIYGFNGKHLGWFRDGIVWDHCGKRVGFLQSTLPVPPQIHPFKGFRKPRPFKRLRQDPPLKRRKLLINSRDPLSGFLTGKTNR